MNIIQKIWLVLFEIISVFSLNFGFCLTNWQPKEIPFTWDSTPVISWDYIDHIEEWSKTFTDKLQWILHLPQKNGYETSLWYVLSLIQIIINRLLWILSFIALVYMLYCWFLVFSAWSDDKNTAKGKQWISTATIALAWIGLSWLIISAMIWFISIISAT